MGHRSNDAGKEFEGRIQNGIIAARQGGIVLWFAHQQPLVTIQRKHIAQSGADFVGVLVGGAMLAVECKSVKGTRLERSAFSVEQEAHLTATSQAGGLALAAIEYRDEQTGIMRAFLLPWVAIPWQTRKIQQSVDVDEIDAVWKLPPEGSIQRHLQKCVGCGAWWPRLPGRTNCCCGGPPF